MSETPTVVDKQNICCQAKRNKDFIFLQESVVLESHTKGCVLIKVSWSVCLQPIHYE